MSRVQVRAAVVAIIDWRTAAPLTDNAALARRFGPTGGSRPRRRPGSPAQRSLVLRADGSGELQRFTVATTARRLVAAGAGRDTGKTGTKRRG